MNKTVATKKAKTAGKSSKPQASDRPVAAAAEAAAAKKVPAKAKAEVANAPPASAKSQAQRLLEAVQKARAGQSRGDFARNLGKATLARNARKKGKGEIGGSNV